MRNLHRLFLIAFLLAAPLAASAQQAFTVRDTEVFAGPSSEFPPVAVLRANAGVRIAGCLADWSWCDIIISDLRGWVYAGDIVVPYQNDRVAVVDYGPQLGFAIVAFSLHSYWGQHYRGRPWYGEREQWARRVPIEADRGGPPPRGRSARARDTEPQQQPQAGAPRERARDIPESRRSAPGAGGQPPAASPRPQTRTPPADGDARGERDVKPPQGRVSPGAGGTPPARDPRPQQESKPQTDDARSGRSARPPQEPSPKAGQPRERSKEAPEAQRPAPGAGDKPSDKGPRSGDTQKKEQGARGDRPGGGDKSQGGKKDRDRD
jgi:uncharacterized protein YraI